MLQKPLDKASAARAPTELAACKILAIAAFSSQGSAALKKHNAQPFQPQEYPNIYRERSKAFRPALRPQQGLH